MDPLHKKRKELVEEYFQNIPNIHPQMVFDLLPNVWQLMKDNDVLPEMSYPEFQQTVLNAYMNEQMQHEMIKMNKPPRQKVECTVEDAPKDKKDEIDKG